MFMMSTLLTVTLFTSTILDGTIVGIYFNRGVRARILMWPRNMNVRVLNYSFFLGSGVMQLMSWQLIVADAIVVWRMIVLYQNKVVRIGILFLLFSFGSELQSASPPFYTDRFSQRSHCLTVLESQQTGLSSEHSFFLRLLRS
jgi:hypothetical protein